MIFILGDVKVKASVLFFGVLVMVLAVLSGSVSFAGFPNEDISSRSLVALSRGSEGIFLSWRTLSSDNLNTQYRINRKDGNSDFVPVAVIMNSSNFLDSTVEIGKIYTYYITSLNQGKTDGSTNRCTITASGESRNYININLKSSRGLAHLTAGDIDADGIYDYVAQTPAVIADGSSETFKLEVYKSSGEFLWQKDTGCGIDPIDKGPIWTNAYIMWDLDGDDKAEIIARIRDGNSYYMIAYEGLTGVEKSRIKWPDPVDVYNDRHVIAIAFLDGANGNPSVILQVGTYDRTILNAYDYKESGFVSRWARQGLGDGTAGHGIDIIDYDGDGRDEIIQGATLVDENGNVVWTKNLGHMDIMAPGDINPNNPGFEIFYGTCSPLDAPVEGTFLVDMDNGEILWKHTEETESYLYHLHGGWAANVTNDYPGWECWCHNKPANNGNDDPYLYNGVSGNILSRTWITNQERISWDDDDEIELTIIHNNGYRIFNYPDHATNNIIDCEGTFLMIMDVVGDFRDEIILAKDNSFRIYTNTELSQRKKITPLYDRHYRLDVSRSGSGYYKYSSVLYSDQKLGSAPVNSPPNPPTGVIVRNPD